jgi:catechol 2,3-dioxygenase-like lactoylglutathione lyase family enzyme
MPPRIGSVLETSLYVDDPERSSKFYEKIFGFRTVVTDRRLYAMSAAPAQLLLLFRKKASADHDGDGRLHLGFSIERRVTWPAGGQSLYFRDPDQHLLEVATPGIWPVY